VTRRLLGALLLGCTVTEPPSPPPSPPASSASTPRDFDADNFPDPSDRCPRDPGPAPFGCPDPDTDDDDFPASADRCPDIPGIEPDGCPPKDDDHDLVIDVNDRCLGEPETENGFQDHDGCPDTIPADLELALRPIPGTYFIHAPSNRRFALKPSAHPLLDRIVRALARYPDVRIEIDAHFDSTERIEYGADPSKRRAEWIKQYLTEHGIDAQRIHARGIGPDEPLDTNKTAVGRALNRRIEFTMLSDP